MSVNEHSLFFHNDPCHGCHECGGPLPLCSQLTYGSVPPIQRMFANGSCACPMLAPSNLFQTLLSFLPAFVALRCAVRGGVQCAAVYGAQQYRLSLWLLLGFSVFHLVFIAVDVGSGMGLNVVDLDDGRRYGLLVTDVDVDGGSSKLELEVALLIDVGAGTAWEHCHKW